MSMSALASLVGRSPWLNVEQLLPKKRQVLFSFDSVDRNEVARLAAADQVFVIDVDLALDAMARDVWVEEHSPRLAPRRGRCLFYSVSGDLAFDVDGDGYGLACYFRRGPEGSTYGRQFTGGRWWGRELRRDEQGSTWARQLFEMVMDDFGTLVVVEGGTA